MNSIDQNSDDNNSNGNGNINETANKKRRRRSPQRYGAGNRCNLLESFDETLSMEENSFDDDDFIKDNIRTEKKTTRKANGTAAAMKQQSKKKKENETELIEIVNLDVEFESLSKSVSETTSPSNGYASFVNEIPIEMNDEIRDNEEKEAICVSDVFNLCKSILQQVHEIYARISVIEDTTLLKNGTLIATNHKSNMVKNIEDNRIFTVTNRLPLKNVDDLIIFEEKLNDMEFMKIAVI